MGKKKTRTSLFSSLAEQCNPSETSAEFHLVDNEYFAAFQSLDDIRQFHHNLLENQPEQQRNVNEDEAEASSDHDDNEMDMKSFAQQFLIDLPKEKSERMAMDDANSDSSLRRIPSGTAASHELFGADQPINWLPKLKGNQMQSPDSKKRKSLQTNPSPSKSITDSPNSGKRQRRSIREMAQSSSFIFMSDNDITDDGENTNHSSANIFTCLQESGLSTPEKRRSNRIAFEDMSSILLTLDIAGKKSKHTSPTKRMNELSTSIVNESDEPTISMELAEPSIIKSEPMEQLVIAHVVEAKEEPVEMNVTTTGVIGFGTAEYSGGLDNYVQNIHLIHPSPPAVHLPEPSVVISPVPIPAMRPKRIRKRKKLFDETETVAKPKRGKMINRKKRLPTPTLETNVDPTLFTDAEIEQQFGELLPVVKSEQDENHGLQADLQHQQTVNSRVVIEIEPMPSMIQRPPTPVPQTPIEKARAKLTKALGRGQGPDTFLLKIRSRESKMIEVQLAIYATSDWHSHRVAILAKIEEALRGLRVSWTKIDIRVEDFDVQICTSPQVAPAATPSSSAMASNSSWFLKSLSESGPLIVHIHDRRYPQQRNLLKCPCPQCSPTTIAPIDHSTDCSLPVIVSVAPVPLPAEHHRPAAPSILSNSQQSNRPLDSTISSIHNLKTAFFTDLTRKWGTKTIISVTQCVLDLTLITSVHAALPSLRAPSVFPKDEYRRKYQQIIDPLKYTNTSDKQSPSSLPKSATIARIISKNGTAQPVVVGKPQGITLLEPDILTFYRTLKQNDINIRSAKAMRNAISSYFSRPKSTLPNVIKATPITTLILPKQTSSLCLPPTTIAPAQPSVTLVGLTPSTTDSAITATNSSRRARRRSLPLNRCGKRSRVQVRSHMVNNNSMAGGTKQQAHFTPIIELKPILSGPTMTTQGVLSSSLGENEETDDETETIVDPSTATNGLKKVTKIISASLMHKQQNVLQRVGTIQTREITPQLVNGARVIRLSIAKPSLPITTNVTSPPSIRLLTPTTQSATSVVGSPKNESIGIANLSPSHPTSSNAKSETIPLVPKQINIIKQLSSSSTTPAMKLSNPVLISNKFQQQSTVEQPSTK